MKKFIFLLSLFFLTATQAQDWEKTWKKALINAETSNKPILLIFSGSDWCAPCIKLDRNIWTSEQFKSYSKQELIIYKADFPRKKANQLPSPITLANKNLAATYNPNGYFPLVLLLHKNKVLGQTGFQNITPEAYIAMLKGFYEK